MKLGKGLLQHTVHFAVAINTQVTNDSGQPVAAWIMPVRYFWIWLPAWLWTWLDSWMIWGARRRPRSRQATPKSWPLDWLFDWAGWRNDLPWIAWAAWLLMKERRFAYG